MGERNDIPGGGERSLRQTLSVTHEHTAIDVSVGSTPTYVDEGDKVD